MEKIRRVQGSTRVASDPVAHTSAQEKADRVLTAIREKLSRDTSVENKVNQLIQQARATDHLATIFVGEYHVGDGCGAVVADPYCRLAAVDVRRARREKEGDVESMNYQETE